MVALTDENKLNAFNFIIIVLITALELFTTENHLVIIAQKFVTILLREE